MLVDNLFRRSHGSAAAAVGKRGDVAASHHMTNAGDATTTTANKTANLTLGIVGAVLTGMFLLWFVTYNIRLATRGELCATYKRQQRRLRELLASAGRGIGNRFRPATWKKLPGSLKWFFSSQNGCWTCACFRIPKNNDDGNNNNTNTNTSSGGSDNQTTHSKDGGGSGSNSPFISHIGPDISHLFQDTDSAVAALEPPAETHPALRRDSAMLAATNAGDAAVAARQHQNPHQIRVNNNNNSNSNNCAQPAAAPPLRHTMTWPAPPRAPSQSSGRATAEFTAAWPEGSMAARPPSRYGPLSSHPMDQQRWYPNHQQQHHHHHQRLQQQQQQQQQYYHQQHQHQHQRHLAPPPPARGGGPPVLPLDLAGPSMRDPGRSRPTSIGSNYCAELLEHARPWLLWASSPPPEPTFSSTPGPNGALVRNKSRGKRLSWLRDGGRSRRASAVLEG